MSAQVAADLRAAADVLREHGWGRGAFSNRVTGCRCVAGAIPECDLGSTRWCTAVNALGRHLGVGPSPIHVYRWNDTPGRTADEVIAALEAAAVKAEQDAGQQA